jgi:hypothetical protein
MSANLDGLNTPEELWNAIKALLAGATHMGASRIECVNVLLPRFEEAVRRDLPPD